MFFGDGCIVLNYVNGILITVDMTSKMHNLILSLHGGDKNKDFTDEGSINKYIGVDIKNRCHFFLNNSAFSD